MPTDPKCQESFDRQGFMRLIGARLLEAAVASALEGSPTRDLGGNATTEEFGAAVVAHLTPVAAG